MRVNENWALLFAQERALEQKVPSPWSFVLSRSSSGLPPPVRVSLEGLREVEGSLERLDIPFFLLEGRPGNRSFVS